MISQLTRAVLRLTFENNLEREAVICFVFLYLPKSTYKALSPSFINNVSTKAFEKTIVHIRLSLWAMVEKVRMDLKSTQRAPITVQYKSMQSREDESYPASSALLFSFNLVQIKMSRPTHSKQHSPYIVSRVETSQST